MTVTAWRVVKVKHKAGAFSGQGAKDHGGRWNSKGSAAVYAAGSLSLAILEILMHLDDAALLSAYGCFALRIPGALVEVPPPGSIPANWASPTIPREVQEWGDRWLKSGKSAVLQVPSAAYRLEGTASPESNYLLNPAHKDFGKIEIGEFRRLGLDERLR